MGLRLLVVTLATVVATVIVATLVMSVGNTIPKIGDTIPKIALVHTKVCDVFMGLEGGSETCVERWHFEYRPNYHILRGSQDYVTEGRPN